MSEIIDSFNILFEYKNNILLFNRFVLLKYFFRSVLISMYKINIIDDVCRIVINTKLL